MKRSKNQILNSLKAWAEKNNYLMKPITSSKNNNLKMLTLEIAFINERLQRIAFIIEITRWETGNWRLTSFTEMFESAHCRFNYIQDVLKGE